MTRSGSSIDNSRLAAALLADATAELAAQQARHAHADRAEQEEQQRRTLAERQRSEVAERDARRRAAAVRMREQDSTVFVVALGSIVTVLVPYLIGHFVMRHTPLLSPDSAVYDGAVRGLGDHFVPDYLAGMAAIMASAAVFLLVRPWYHRMRWVVTGWTMVLLLIAFLLPAVSERWRDSERTSVGKLATTAFPFASRYYTCDSYRYPISWQRGNSEVWQIYLAQEGGFAGAGCNQVVVYNGWRRVGVFTTPNGDTLLPNSWHNTDISGGGFYLYTIWVSVNTARHGTLRFTLAGAQNNEFQFED